MRIFPLICAEESKSNKEKAETGYAVKGCSELLLFWKYTCLSHSKTYLLYIW